MNENISPNANMTQATKPDSLPPLAQAPGSALALDVQNAIKKGDAIGTYDIYAEWLASLPQGILYLKQAISVLAWRLQKCGNMPRMRQAVDEVMDAERALADDQSEAQNK